MNLFRHGEGTKLPAASTFPDTPPSGEGIPRKVTLLIEWPGGQVREYTAANPLGFRQVVAPSGEMANLPSGFTASSPMEPVVAVMFSGNPATGGIQVRAEGKL